MKNRKKIVVGAVLALVALIVLLNVLRPGNGQALEVTTEKVQKRDLVEKVSATGEIKPKKNINISTDVAGKTPEDTGRRRGRRSAGASCSSRSTRPSTRPTPTGTAASSRSPRPSSSPSRPR